MKNQLIFIVLITFSLSVKAQIYVPGGTIQGSSSNNNVGIGTNSPMAKLETLNTTAGVTSFKTVGVNGYLLVDNVGSGENFYNATNFHEFQIGGVSKVRINSNGNVGIGTANPTVKLHVNSTDVAAFFKSTTNAVPISIINDGTSVSTIGFKGSTSLNEYNVRVGADGNDFISYTSNVERMRINSNGNVGIGTTNPDAKLTVNGDAKIKQNLFISGSSGGYTTGDNPVLYFGVNSDFAKISVPFGDKMILSSYHGYTFNTSNNGSIAIPALTIGITGNVGIGTTTPDEKLTVKGKIHTQEVRVDMLGPLVPDYVFSNDYQLKPLHEVEDYIKENSHLPEIPSAKEIEKNGLMLAEMNMSLLKKIEELTLYAIEQQKNTAKLIQLLDEQNKRLKILEENRN